MITDTATERIAERKALRADYAKNPVLCRVCQAPLLYEQAHSGGTHCSRICSQVTIAAAKRGRKRSG